MTDSGMDIIECIKRASLEASEATSNKAQRPVIQSIIFGYGYRARSGKDTAANWITLNRSISPLVFEGYSIKKYSFAKALKQEVTEMALKSGGMLNLFSEGLRYPDAGYYRADGAVISLPAWVQYDPVAPMDDPDCPLGKQRTFLQFWGAFRRSENPMYWINKVSPAIVEEKPDVALISDLRHLNEFEFCLKHGETVRVDRPDISPLQGAAGTHASETELDSIPDERWSDIIKNDSSLKVFRERVLFSFDMLMSIQR